MALCPKDPGDDVQTETAYVEARIRCDHVIITVAAPCLVDGLFHLALPGARVLCVSIERGLDVEVPLPVDVERRRITATCSNGVLEVRLDRTVET